MKRNRHGKPVEPPITDFTELAKKVAEKAPNTVVHSDFQGGHSVDFRSNIVIRTQQIAIGLPMDELMFSQFLTNFVHLNIMPWDSLITTQSTYLPDARNSIHNTFLEKTGGSHLFMLDSDVLPQPDIIHRLLAHNLPLVGGWYKKKEKYPVKNLDGSIKTIQRPVVYDYAEEGFTEKLQPGKGLEKVGGAGAGLWMMRRDVAEALGKSPYGNDVGEDLILCRKVTEVGFDMWIDWDLPAAHCGVFYV